MEKQINMQDILTGRYTPTPVEENPALRPRLEKLKEENLAASTREFVESLLEFFNKRGGLDHKSTHWF